LKELLFNFTKMKFLIALALCGLLSVTSGAPAEEKKAKQVLPFVAQFLSQFDHNLGHDLHELYEITPTDEIIQWLIEKIQSDEDAKTLLRYLKSDHFKTIDAFLLKDDWPLSHLSYLFTNGVTGIYELTNTIRQAIDLPQIEPPKVTKKMFFDDKLILKTNTLAPDIKWELWHLVEELYYILEPVFPQYKEWYESKKDDEHVIALFNVYKNDQTREFAEYAASGKEVQELAQLLREGNIPVDEIVQALKDALGWN